MNAELRIAVLQQVLPVVERFALRCADGPAHYRASAGEIMDRLAAMSDYNDDAEARIAAAVAAERERCAAICEDYAETFNGDGSQRGNAARSCAAEIREATS